MTKVSFHFNVADRRDYTCRLLRKAYRSGARVVVVGPSQVLADLDRSLWTFDPLDFLPHWRGKSGSALPERLRRTPVVLLDTPSDGHGFPVLVNLHAEIPVVFDAYERVIEIVSRQEADRSTARLRWRAYTQAGVSIERHEVAA